MIKLKIFIAALCAAFFVPSVHATELTIYVYADRTPSSVASSTYSYDIVDSNSLNDVSSVNVVTSGPKGQMSSLYIRGTDSDQSLITLNGIPIKDHSSPTSTDDIGQHNFTGIRSIEIYKGPMSNLFGANAAGGVVNLISDISTRSYVSSTIGSNNLVKGQIQISYNSSDIDYTINLQAESTNGISVYPNGEETDPYKNKNLNLNILYPNQYGNIRLNHINETNFTNLDSMYDTKNYTGEWNWNNTQLDYNNDVIRFVINNSNHKRTYTKDNELEGNYQSKVNSLYSSYMVNYKNTDVIIGSELEKVDANFLVNIRGQYPYTSSVDKKRTTTGLFVNSNTIHLNSLVLSTGIRYDNIDNFGEKITGRVGVFKDGWRGSISTGFRIPTLYEMYGQDNYGFTGNPSLKEESTINYEVGYSNYFSDTAFFVTKENNAIIYNGTYINDQRQSHTQGIENKLTYEIYGFYLLNNFSYTLAKQSDGEQKLRRPKIINNFTISKIIKNTVYSVDINYFGKHRDINSKTFMPIYVDGVTTLDAEINYEKNNIEMFAGIYNITNKQFERPNGYSQLGRNFTLGFRKYF